MRKNTVILLTIVLLFSFLGCTAQENGPVQNDLFTDAFFADVVEICDSRTGVVSGDQMEPVIQYLKGLTLTATSEHLSTTNENGEELAGLDAITFKKGDGTEIVFLRNHMTMSCVSRSDVCSYVTDGENLNSGLKEAFDQASNSDK